MSNVRYWDNIKIKIKIINKNFILYTGMGIAFWKSKVGKLLLYKWGGT